MFEIENNESTPLLLILEPEGIEFFVLPEKSVTVESVGKKESVTCKYSRGSDGGTCVSLWPTNDDEYQVFQDGKNILGQGDGIRP